VLKALKGMYHDEFKLYKGQLDLKSLFFSHLVGDSFWELHNSGIIIGASPSKFRPGLGCSYASK